MGYVLLYSPAPLRILSLKTVKFLNWLILSYCKISCLSMTNLRNKLPASLSDKFTFTNTGNSTRNVRNNQLNSLKTRTILYGSKSIESRCIDNWNSANDHFHDLKFQDKSRAYCKEIVAKLLIDRY